jgi:hypothetical protein
MSIRNHLSFRPLPGSCEVLENPRVGVARAGLGTNKPRLLKAPGELETREGGDGLPSAYLEALNRS